MTNLADQPDHMRTKARLASALEASLIEQGDPGIPLDTEKAHRTAANSQPLFPATDETDCHLFDLHLTCIHCKETLIAYHRHFDLFSTEPRRLNPSRQAFRPIPERFPVQSGS